MTFDYRLTRAARRNLEEISDYWTSDAGPEVALEILGGIMETMITLSGQPRAGVVAEQFGKGVRKFPIGNLSSPPFNRNRGPSRVSRSAGSAKGLEDWRQRQTLTAAQCLVGCGMSRVLLSWEKRLRRRSSHVVIIRRSHEGAIRARE